jgi:hypothetical protein
MLQNDREQHWADCKAKIDSPRTRSKIGVKQVVAASVRELVVVTENSFSMQRLVLELDQL